MYDIDWRLAPQGTSPRDFQSTLFDAMVCIQKNTPGITYSTEPLLRVRNYLEEVRSDMLSNKNGYLVERLNLMEIAVAQYELPHFTPDRINRDAFICIEFWLEGKVQMINTALFQEYPRAQQATFAFLAAWRTIVSDNHLN